MAKICAHCGNKCSFLGDVKLGDGTIVCNNCCEYIAEKNGEAGLNLNFFRHVHEMTLSIFEDMYNNPELASQYNTWNITQTTQKNEKKEIGGIVFDDLNEEMKFPFFPHFSEKYKYSQLVQYEYFENQNSIATGGSGIGRAMIGGVLFGGVGAIVGAATKQHGSVNIISDISVLFTFNVDGKMVIEKKKINDWSDNDIKPGSNTYIKYLTIARELMAKAEEIYGRYHNLDQENQKELQSVTVLSGADELKKYKELLDDGVITENEFQEKKKQILGL